jgi:phosphopantothenoylcysteine decarboxylase/phosphopantothenate--cysteine ligase
LRVLLGITGGIAAYKATGLVRALRELGHDVTVLPTENALRFIGKPTLEALSGKSIDIDLFHDIASVKHVQLRQQADLILIAPATASFIGRLAGGLADDLLMNAILASKAEVVVAPAMHTEMWQNPATQANVVLLQQRGIRVMEPATGRLTGADSGPGRLPEVEDIVKFVFSTNALSGKSIIVTAGGTREPIDAVRFIGNSSSGLMGVEIAREAAAQGASVRLVGANLEVPVPAGVELIAVSSVDELEQAMDQGADAIVMAAAVSDFRVANPHPGKMSRSQGVNLELVPTKDLIANYMARHPGVFGVAFALADQTADLEEIARQKLWDKGVQLVVGNTVKALGSSESSVLLVSGETSRSVTGSKDAIAKLIVDAIANEIVEVA